MELPEHYIHLILPERNHSPFDPSGFETDFEARWGNTIACGQTPQMGGDSITDIYLAGDGRRNVRLAFERKKLPPQFVQLLDSPFYSLRPKESSSLLKHIGSIRLDYLMGESTPLERVQICAEMLLTLVSLRKPVGVVNIAAQSYKPIERISSYLESVTILEPVHLCYLFVNSQAVKTDDSFAIHTHGMEQFLLPNLEIPFPSGTELSSVMPLMTSLITEVIETEQAPPAGDKYTLKGVPKVFRARAARSDIDHPTGLVVFE